MPADGRRRLWLAFTAMGGSFWIYLIGREFWKSRRPKKRGAGKKLAAAR